MRLLLSFIFCALLLTGCSVNVNQTEAAGKNPEKVSPEATVEKFAQALAKNDVDTALSLYAPEVFRMEGVAEEQAKQLLKDQLSKQEVPVFSNGTMKVDKVTNYAQVDYTVGGKVRHLLLKETTEGWRISSSIIAD